MVKSHFDRSLMLLDDSLLQNVDDFPSTALTCGLHSLLLQPV